MRTREILGDIGLVVVLVLLLPLAIPIAALAFLFLLGQRLPIWGRRQAGDIG